jgi:ribose transport system substrate-binding protein
MSVRQRERVRRSWTCRRPTISAEDHNVALGCISRLATTVASSVTGTRTFRPERPWGDNPELGEALNQQESAGCVDLLGPLESLGSDQDAATICCSRRLTQTVPNRRVRTRNPSVDFASGGSYDSRRLYPRRALGSRTPFRTQVASQGLGSRGTSDPSATKEGSNAVFLASAANTYWTAELERVKDAVKKHGDVQLTVFDAQFNTNKQVNQLRDALISRRYQAWFVGPNDGGPLTPTIKRAISQGMKVTCTLVPCGPNIRNPKVQIPGQVAQIGIGFYENGRVLGRLTVRACGNLDPCEVVWLPGLPTLPLEKARSDGLYSIIKRRKSIKVVAVQAGGYLAAPALTATQNILQAHPDVDVIVSSGDQMIAGAYRAAWAKGVEDEIKMFGNGCTFEAKRDILARKIYGCAVYVPRTEARVAADLLNKAVKGQKISGRYVDPLRFSSIGSIGTRANIGRFKPEFHS